MSLRVCSDWEDQASAEHVKPAQVLLHVHVFSPNWVLIGQFLPTMKPKHFINVSIAYKSKQTSMCMLVSSRVSHIPIYGCNHVGNLRFTVL